MQNNNTSATRASNGSPRLLTWALSALFAAFVTVVAAIFNAQTKALEHVREDLQRTISMQQQRGERVATLEGQVLANRENITRLRAELAYLKNRFDALSLSGRRSTSPPPRMEDIP